MTIARDIEVRSESSVDLPELKTISKMLSVYNSKVVFQELERVGGDVSLSDHARLRAPKLRKIGAMKRTSCSNHCTSIHF